MLIEESTERQRERLVASCFTAYQGGAGAKHETFEQYLRRWGVQKKEPAMSAEEKERVKAKALATAEKIDAAFRAGKIAK